MESPATPPDVRRDERPLVVHLLHRFDTGGLENGVVNLINHMPAYRHAVVAVTEVTDFKSRVSAPGTVFHALNKPPGQGLWLYPRVYRLLRQLKPAVVHTRNLGAMEFTLPAWAARVPLRLHGEHGYDVNDLDGSHKGNQRLRRLYAPFVHRFVALSQDLANYLTQRVGIAQGRVHQLYNGVDADRFFPPAAGELPPPDWPFEPGRHVVIGGVGRMHPVKDPLNLVQAFIGLLEAQPDLRATLRLVMLGGGPLQAEAMRALQEAGCAELAWLPGDRRDVPALLRWFDVYVQPSRAEGISNTVLEAMACGRAIVATAVGGTPELLRDGSDALLVPSADTPALQSALRRLIDDVPLRQGLGQAARQTVLARFSLQRMVDAYQSLYDGALRR
jgi:sugar transferase (PEP-CTERM/EpsH1 system associated)